VGRAFGLSGLLGNLGLAASPIISAMVGAAWGWRAAFWLGAVPGLLLGPALWRYPLPRPAASGAPENSPRLALPAAGRALTRPLLLLFALETLMGFIVQGFSTFFPAHLAARAEIPGLTAAQVTRGGMLASLALLFGGGGHLLAGRLMGSGHRAAFFRAIMTLCMCCLFAMALVTGPALVLVSIAMTLTYFALGTMSNTFIAAETPPHLASTAFGVTFTLAFCVGSLAAASMGLVAEQAGLAHVFAVLGLVAAGSLAIVVGFTRAARTSLPPAPSR
jgi:predicted MFS family arabinose efflux permease